MAYKITAWGEVKTIAEWARDHRARASYNAIYQRITRLAWHPEPAISTPSQRGGTPQ